MNLPNRLTLFRVALIPVFLILYLADPFKGDLSKYTALGVFLAASLTDMLDGAIARKYNLVTNFGKLMDPLADKLLVASALIAMVERAELAGWAAIIIIAREFAVTGFRMLSLERGVVIAAGRLGKLKMISQIVMIACILLGLPPIVNWIMIWLTVALTIASACEYLYTNRGLLKEGETK